MAASLFACTMSPFVEMLFRSDNSIFASGRDTESTLALVLLLIELSFAIARLLVSVAPVILQRVEIVRSRHVALRSSIVASVAPTISPPVPLRI